MQLSLLHEFVNLGSAVTTFTHVHYYHIRILSQPSHCHHNSHAICIKKYKLTFAGMQTKWCLDHDTDVVNCWKRRTLCTGLHLLSPLQRYTWCANCFSKDHQAPVTTFGESAYDWLVSHYQRYIYIGTGMCTKTYCYPTTQSGSVSSWWRLKQPTHIYEPLTVYTEVTAALQASLLLLFRGQLWL